MRSKNNVLTVKDLVLDEATKYQVVVKRVKNSSNLEMLGECVWEFATTNYTQNVFQSSVGDCGGISNFPDTVSAKVVNLVPTGDAVPATTAITITFDKPIDTKTVKSNIILSKFSIGSSSPISVSPLPYTFSYDATNYEVVLSPKINPALETTTKYQVTVLSGVKDMNGNSLEADFGSSFTTSIAPDTTPPILLNITPSDKASVVTANINIVATFSEPMNQSLFTTDTFTIKDSNGVVVDGTYSFPSTTKVKFTPTKTLNLLHSYSITLSGLKDQNDNALDLNVNTGKSVFNTLDGNWVVDPNPLVKAGGTVTYLDKYQLLSDNKNNAMLVWQDYINNIDYLDTQSIYSKSYTVDIGWEKSVNQFYQGKAGVDTAVTNIEMSSNGDVLLTYSERNITSSPSPSDFYDVVTYGSPIYFARDFKNSNNNWSNTIKEFNTLSDTVYVKNMTMSSNGKATLLLEVVNVTDPVPYYATKKYIPQPKGSLDPEWQPTDSIERIGTFGNIVAYGKIEGYPNISITNDGVGMVLYYQYDAPKNSGGIANLWVNYSPFQSSIPVNIENRNVQFSPRISNASPYYSIGGNGSGITVFQYEDSTWWLNTHLKNKVWGKAEIIPFTESAFILEAVLLPNNEKMIFFMEYYTSIVKAIKYISSGWQAPTIVADLSTNNRNDDKAHISYNKSNNIITVIWATSTDILAKRYSPVTGWQPDKIIISYIVDPNKTDELYNPKSITNDDGTSQVVWSKGDAAGFFGYGFDIFTATLQ